MVDSSKSQILERPGAQGCGELLSRRVDTEAAARDLFEQILKLFV
jgi:hypothetical protein